MFDTIPNETLTSVTGGQCVCAQQGGEQPGGGDPRLAQQQGQPGDGDPNAGGEQGAQPGAQPGGQPGGGIGMQILAAIHSVLGQFLQQRSGGAPQQPQA